MPQFHVTFGQQYAHEPHPTFPDAHPDGWVTIEADDYEAARAIAFREMGRNWAFIYEVDDFEYHYFPRGELARLP